LATKAKATTTTLPITNGSLPKGWRMVRLGEVVRDVNEAERNPLDAGLERFVGLEHIEPENLHLKQWGLLADSDISFTKRFRKGQVLFGKRRAYQRKVAVAEFDGICSSDVLTFEPKDDALIPELLPFIVQSDGLFNHALGTSSGSLSPRTRWSLLQNYEFPLPPKDEQRRIADILWAADEVANEWRDAQADHRALGRSYLTHQLMAEKHARVLLGTCLQGIEPGKSVVGRNEPAAANARGVLKVSAVGPSGFIPNENKVLLDDSDFRPEFVVRAYDLLMTRSNTPDLVGRTCLVDKDYPYLMLCDKTLRLVTNDLIFSKQLLLAILQSDEVRSQIKGLANGTGGAMKNISQASIRAIRIPQPSREDQLKMHNLISDINASGEAMSDHLKNASAFFATLRDYLLRGASHVH
jgi:type I restriction enzyme S subunit